MDMAADEDIIDVLYRCRSEGKDIGSLQDSLSNNFFKEQQAQRAHVRSQLAKQTRQQQPSKSPSTAAVMMRRSASVAATAASAASCTDVSGSGIQAFHSQVVKSIPVDVIPRVFLLYSSPYYVVLDMSVRYVECWK